MLYFIFDYIQKKSAVNDWQFRSPTLESNYWINHKLKKVSSSFPYLAELKEKLAQHRAAIELKAAGTKMKDISAFREMLMVPSDRALYSYVNKIRTNFTQAFAKDRSDYFQELYNFLKKKIDRRVQHLRHRQHLDLDDLLEEDEEQLDKTKPVISE